MCTLPTEAEIFGGVLFGGDFVGHAGDGGAEEEIDEGVGIGAEGLHTGEILGSLTALDDKDGKVVAKEDLVAKESA